MSQDLKFPNRLYLNKASQNHRRFFFSFGKEIWLVFGKTYAIILMMWYGFVWSYCSIGLLLWSPFWYFSFIFLATLQLDFDDGSPPEHAWRRKLSSHANRLKEFNVTFREAIKMVWKMQLSTFLVHGSTTSLCFFVLLKSGGDVWKKSTWSNFVFSSEY